MPAARSRFDVVRDSASPPTSWTVLSAARKEPNQEPTATTVRQHRTPSGFCHRSSEARQATPGNARQLAERALQARSRWFEPTCAHQDCTGQGSGAGRRYPGDRRLELDRDRPSRRRPRGDGAVARRADRTLWTARVAPRSKIGPGSAATLAVDTSNLQFYDPASGLAIGHPEAARTMAPTAITRPGKCARRGEPEQWAAMCQRPVAAAPAHR
jgi:hypothetical protein